MPNGLERVVASIQETAGADPGRAALIVGDHSIAYAALADQIDRVMGLLATRADPRGRVLVDITQPAAFLAGCLGTWAARCSAVVRPAQSTLHERGELEALTEPTIVLSTHHDRFVVAPRASASSPDLASDDIDAEALVLRTSGSTGQPKGVSIGTVARYRCVSEISAAYEMSRRKPLIICTPVTHSAGLTFALAQLLAGGLTILTEQFTGSRLYQLVASHHDASVLVVPMLLDRLLDSSSSNTYRPSRVICMGAALADAQRHRLRKSWPDTDLIEYYGCSEYPHIAWARDKSTDRPSFQLFKEIEARTSGHASPNLNQGQVGNLEVRGPFKMRGYITSPSVLTEAPEWIPTGDRASIAGDTITLHGRVDDIVMIGGVSIRPKEVERILARSSDVNECAVVALPDDHYGHQLIAIISVRGDTHEARERIHRAAIDELGAARRPRHFVFVDRLPRDTMGKVTNRALKSLAHKAAGQTARR